TQIDTPDVSRITDQQTTTYEEGDGNGFTFVTRSFIDDTVDKELKGSAKLSEDGTQISLDKPTSQKFELDRTNFPTQHLLELLDKAREGETFYETTIFDGSED